MSSLLFGRCGCALWRAFTRRSRHVLILQKIRGIKGGSCELKTKKDRGDVMSCIQGHHSSDIPSITLKKQNSVLTSQWRELRGGQTGREEN